MSLRARVAALLILTLSILSCDPATVLQNIITITPTDVEIFVGSSQQLSVVDAPTTVSWSSSNDNIASVVPETGFVVAIARGTAVITATSGNASAQVTVKVLAPRSLALTPPSLSFQALVGAANPPSQTVVASNAGDGAISNIALGTTTYGDGEPTGWLTVSPSGSTAPVTLTFNVSTAGLPRGTYSATVPVLAAGIDNSPQQIAVTFLVEAPATIALSRTTVPMQGIPGVQIVEQVNITNPGDIPLTGLSQSIIYNGAAGQTWLSASLSSTSAPSTTTLTANTTGLAPASYSAIVRIASTIPGVATRDIAVQLTVIPGPSIQLSSTTVIQNATFGVNPQAPTVNVANGGGGTLSGLALGTVAYGAGANGWVTPLLNVSTAPAIITLTINSAALAAGTYTATVPVTSGVASNSPVNIGVTLTVGAAPTMVLSRATVPMSGIPGTILNEVVDITSSGAQITGLSRTIIHTVGPAGWLTATFNFAATPSILTLVGNTTGLAPGLYAATVRVSSTTPGVAARDIAVQLTVNPGPAITLSTSSVVANPGFGTDPAPIQVNVTNGGGGTLSNLSLGTTTYSGAATNWLARTLNTTTAPAQITLTITSNGLLSGVYSATVPVMSTVASNSPTNLGVTLTVGPGPIITLSTNSVLFTAWGNQAIPAATDVGITNTGGGVLSGLSVSGIIYSGAAPANWLSLPTFPGGVTAPTAVRVRPNTTDRSAGTGTALVTVSSSVLGVTSKTLSVNYTMQTFSASLFPIFQTAGCAGCHTARAPVIAAGTTSTTYYNNLINGGFVIPGNATGSPLVQRIFTVPGLSHTGGKYNSIANFSAFVTSWIAAGAPNR